MKDTEEKIRELEREERIRELENEVKKLKARNEELHAAQEYISSHVHASVSPLVLSPSSIPPSEDSTNHSVDHKLEEEFHDQLKLKDRKIQYLEQNLALYKQKLTQTEELLYSLQWSQAEDQAVALLGGDAVTKLLEKRITQLLEQMRIMEKALKDKQTLINKLSEPPQSSFHTSLVCDSHYESSTTTADELISTLNGLTLIPLSSQNNN